MWEVANLGLVWFFRPELEPVSSTRFVDLLQCSRGRKYRPKLPAYPPPPQIIRFTPTVIKGMVRNTTPRHIVSLLFSFFLLCPVFTPCKSVFLAALMDSRGCYCCYPSQKPFLHLQAFFSPLSLLLPPSLLIPHCIISWLNWPFGSPRANAPLG